MPFGFLGENPKYIEISQNSVITEKNWTSNKKSFPYL